ncbi:unnamed protein product, partial [Rotaria magnacalcarata]
DSSSQHYTRESIMLALKYKPKEYTTVKKKSKAKCWSKFGLTAKIIGPGKFEIIKNFASFSSNENQSKIELISLVKSNTSTTYSDTTTSDRINSVNHKTLQKHKRLITSVISDWCSAVGLEIFRNSVGYGRLGWKFFKTRSVTVGSARDFSGYGRFGWKYFKIRSVTVGSVRDFAGCGRFGWGKMPTDPISDTHEKCTHNQHHPFRTC